MTIQECYQKLGGDFAGVEQRLRSVSLIKRFITKFLEDDSFSNLFQAMQAGKREEAFRAAHTLKGVCANLSFTRLCASASALTEALRPQGEVLPAQALPLLEEVSRDYRITVDAIRRYLGAA